MSTKQSLKTAPDRKLRVGVTIHLKAGYQSIWENGIFQNCVFLVQLFNQSPLVEEAVLINGGDPAATAHSAMMLDMAGVRVVDAGEAFETLDVVIEMSALMPEAWAEAFRAKGGRYAWMRVGNDYVIDIERAMHSKPAGSLCSAKVYDAVWTIPEYERSCVDYFAITTRAPVRIVPHLWTPQFFDEGVKTLPAGLHFGYEPGKPRWRVCAFEPNICMVKSSVIPMMAVEEAYRAHPGFLERFSVCNTLQLKEQVVFHHMARSLDVVRHGLATFEGRFAVYEYMANYGDCIVSHHWENGQNYLYYEALYGGYPLVHNSTFIPGCGYYYPEFDGQAGGEALLRAFAEHDLRLDDYKSSTQTLLHRLDIANPHNIDVYGRELLRLYAGHA